MYCLFSENNFWNRYGQFNIPVRLSNNMLKVTLSHTYAMYKTFLLYTHMAWNNSFFISFLNSSCNKYAFGNNFPWKVCIFDGVKTPNFYRSFYVSVAPFKSPLFDVILPVLNPRTNFFITYMSLLV